MGKVSTPKSIALDSKKQSALTKAIRKVGKSMKAKKLEEADKASRGIILVSHLPYGFFEEAIKGFFSQFGKIRRIRVARSPKTGRSKGYAFIEFEFLEVAEIAAESMNNYLMYERLIKCKVIEPDVDKKKIFAARYIRKNSFPALFRRKEFIKALEEPMDAEEIEKQSGVRAKSIARNNKKLAALGIDYKYDADVNEVVTPSVHVSRKEKVEKSPVGVKAKNKTPEKPEFSPKKSPVVVKAKSKTPEKPKFSPKKSPIGAKATIKTPEMPKLSPKKFPVGAKATIKTPEMPKLSPKKFPVGVRANINTPDMPKLSPKKSPVGVKKTPAKSTFSPKLLRSNARKSEVSIRTPAGEVISPKVNVFKKEKVEKSPAPGMKATTKTPEKSKFSPKILRSKGRKSEVPIRAPEDEVTTPKVLVPKNEKSRKSLAGLTTKTPEKPKFSPKLLRSKARKSELPVPVAKASAAKRRKSMK